MGGGVVGGGRSVVRLAVTRSGVRLRRRIVRRLDIIVTRILRGLGVRPRRGRVRGRARSVEQRRTRGLRDRHW